ncbi:uncharacterized protein LOC116181977 [Photinus pyralis]|uniref:uncharacterized protein LOC116161845 n=1 Tax=Photinus pyralis TaxID=7054 RepID=UPI001266EDB4|nr:uncharacterized protein LOC116161845 [Photinus pyralis]XP_031358637.1 uncharacterized protein LOC116181977 [Photinus pyralis]
MANYVNSIRGRPKLVYDNHLFTYVKMTKDELHAIWVCEKRDVCTGRVWTQGKEGEVVKVVRGHNHAAQAGRPEAVRTINGIKERAVATHEAPQQILATAVAEIHANVAALLPRKDSLKRVIRSARNAGDAPAIPRDVQDLILPQEYKEIAVNGIIQQFLFYDSEAELLPGRMLIFSTPENLLLLSRSREWFADGTFSTAPSLFQQIYTLHVVQYNSVIPVVYALLPNKTRATYVKFLRELKRIQVGLQPSELMMDFEQAAIQAFELEFPQLRITGCFFHLTQSIWRARARFEGSI